MNAKLYEAVREGQLDILKGYCDQGADLTKFMEILHLGIDPTKKQLNTKGKTAVIISAKNNRHMLPRA